MHVARRVQSHGARRRRLVHWRRRGASGCSGQRRHRRAGRCPMTELATTAKDTGRVAKALDSLPTLPIVALRIGEVIHSNNVSVNQVAELLRTDPATSAKL